MCKQLQETEGSGRPHVQVPHLCMQDLSTHHQDLGRVRLPHGHETRPNPSKAASTTSRR